ncbi:MAG TPA: M24 family metallopeptidase [Clostridia bacterium]|nr:M24 family metallopeptidase [Clostridia bacterium]
MLDKLDKLRALLEEREVEGILIERQNHFSWLTGGRGFIGLASEMACGSILVTKDKAYLITTNIEAERLTSEECPGLLPMACPWTREGEKTEIIQKLTGGRFLRDSELGEAFFRLRTSLTQSELATYREQGPLAAEALEAALAGIKPGMTELALAGEISARLWALGMEPITLLVAFDERILKYRHPLPTAAALKRHALAAICARVHGLILSVTRCAHIGPLPEDIRLRQQAVCRVDAALINGARPGISLEALYVLAEKAYADNGFPNEINLHHQGGLTGYVAREKKILPGETHVVASGEAYAFNPSIAGVKGEDTILVRGMAAAIRGRPAAAGHPDRIGGAS